MRVMERHSYSIEHVGCLLAGRKNNVVEAADIMVRGTDDVVRAGNDLVGGRNDIVFVKNNIV